MTIAKLVILDEVNIKIEGLSIECRRAMVKSLEFYVPGARYSPAVRLGRWDGKMSYCTIGGSSYVNLLDILLPIVQKHGYEVDIDDRRIINENFEFELVKEDSYSHILWPTGHPQAGKQITIKQHQVDMINSYLKNQQSINIIPTGGGKTLITGILSHKVQAYGRSIIIVPSKDLVTQTEEDYKNLGLDVGVYFGDRKEYKKTHTICTWQSLEILSKNTKNSKGDCTINEFLDGVVCVISDECFHADAQVLTPHGYKKISDIKVGDLVINYSQDANIFKEDRVEQVFINLTKSSTEKMYELGMDNGAIIKVTGNHKFLTDRGWIRADCLTFTDNITDINVQN